MKRVAIFVILAALTVGFSSCSAVRHCQAPEVEMPGQIASGYTDSLTIADLSWWQFYGDSTLRRVIELTLENNKDMLAAAARVEQMRQLYRISKAERLPNFSAKGLADYETNDYADEESSRDPEFSAKLSVSWELDLWGNLRWAKRKGGAEYLSSVEDWRAMRMTLVAEVATAYFQLMALDNELSIVRRTLRTRSEGVEMPGQIASGYTDSLTIADLSWWQFYGDSTLRRVIELTLENNKDMLAAAARVEQMRQLYRISKAERLPNFSAKGLADYETNDYADEESSRDPEFSAKLSVSWELDLWGNLRWAKRKGGAEYLSSVEDWRAMRMTLVAEVATAYFQLMALDNELSIVRRTLRTRSEGVQQAQLRFEGGLTSETVYQQAKVEYASTATLIPDLESRIEIMENSIALLMGKSPDWEVLRGQMNIEAEFPDSLPVGLPSGLLQRRPDVRASEQQLRSAMASAGMAYADRFPRLTFNLVGGWENDALQGFFRSPFSYVAAAIAAPVFGFGRKQAKYRAALAAYDVARLGYEKKVLEVFKEANDAVVTYRNVRKTAALKVALRDAARKYVELANLQYRGGSINYIDVLDAQRRYFDAQIGLSNAVRDEHLALVQLYKALGGGWGVVAE